MEIHEDTWRVARVRVRRQAEEEEGILTRVEQEVERDARIVADTTGMPTWSGGPHSHHLFDAADDPSVSQSVFTITEKAPMN